MRQNKKTVTETLVGVVTLMSATFALPAIHISNAQEATVGELTQQQLEATWKLQADNVAATFQLSDENQARITKVYVASRKAERAAQTKIAITETDREKLRSVSDKVAQVRRRILKAQLQEFLTAEQADSAIQSLGTFSDRWDRYVNLLANFGLDEDKQGEALNFVSKYIIDHGTAVQEARSKGGRLSPSKSTEMKNGLDTALAKLLSADQLSAWKNASAFRGAGGGSSASTTEKAPGARKATNKQD